MTILSILVDDIFFLLILSTKKMNSADKDTNNNQHKLYFSCKTSMIIIGIKEEVGSDTLDHPVFLWGCLCINFS